LAPLRFLLAQTCPEKYRRLMIAEFTPLTIHLALTLKKEKEKCQAKPWSLSAGCRCTPAPKPMEYLSGWGRGGREKLPRVPTGDGMGGDTGCPRVGLQVQSKKQ
jgi:hypothetical protein